MDSTYLYLTSAPRFPIGTKVKHCGHGLGMLVGYNGQSTIDVEKQIQWLNDLSKEKQQGVEKPLLTQLIQTSVINGMYDGKRYPYILHFQPTEQYPNGYKDVYCPGGIEFSSDGENWVKLQTRDNLSGWEGVVKEGMDEFLKLMSIGINVE